MIRKLLALTNDKGRRQLRILIATICIAAVLQGIAFVLLVPFLEALFTEDTKGMRTWFIALLVAAIAYLIVFIVSSSFGRTSAVELLQSLLDRLGNRLVELPLGYFSVDRSGEASDNATRGIVFASAGPYAAVRPLLDAFITPVVILIGLFFFDWRLAVTMLIAIPFMWLSYRYIARTTLRTDRESNAAVADASARVIEFARVQPSLRVAGDNSIGQSLVQDALVEQHAAAKRVLAGGAKGIVLFGTVVQLALTAVIVIGTYLALDGSMDIPTFLALLVLTIRLLEPVTNAGALGGGMSMINNTLDYIQGLLDEPTLSEPTDPKAPKDHSIRFDNVTFGYGNTDLPVLKDLSFEVPDKSMTAIVGPSGSGKTTITKLVARFYDPESGTVSIGGQPLPELGSTQVVSLVAPVFQDVYLFNGTILDNILIGRPNASQEDVMDAARRARVDKIAESLPQGWDSDVGEGGANLSGGERQRVSIARALLKDAPIVVLDEATAALDPRNEQAIQEAFNSVREGRTILVVAHRMQTIANADHIIMLNTHGNIAEEGTHQELLNLGGGYARYWSERVSAAGWTISARG